ncbi:MAG: hypothetical protein L0Y56_05855 [Nitrospira sp.]|nr:hypothetical protein [Nitrospira sp.]
MRHLARILGLALAVCGVLSISVLLAFALWLARSCLIVGAVAWLLRGEVAQRPIEFTPQVYVGDRR